MPVRGSEGATYCGPDDQIVDRALFKWIAAIESFWTYAVPFSVTLCTDIAVLVFANENKRNWAFENNLLACNFFRNIKRYKTFKIYEFPPFPKTKFELK